MLLRVGEVITKGLAVSDKETQRQLQIAAANITSLRIAVTALATYFGALPAALEVQMQALLAAPGERTLDMLLGQVVILIDKYKAQSKVTL